MALLSNYGLVKYEPTRTQIPKIKARVNFMQIISDNQIKHVNMRNSELFKVIPAYNRKYYLIQNKQIENKTASVDHVLKRNHEI